jgi:hypothetical protein
LNITLLAFCLPRMDSQKISKEESSLCPAWEFVDELSLRRRRQKLEGIEKLNRNKPRNTQLEKQSTSFCY